MITNSVEQHGDLVVGLYESDSTYLKIFYVNKVAKPDTDISEASLDVKQMFIAMEALDRRKGRK